MYKNLKKLYNGIKWGIIVPTVFSTTFALADEIDWKRLGNQDYLEKKVLAISGDYNPFDSKGSILTEIKN